VWIIEVDAEETAVYTFNQKVVVECHNDIPERPLMGFMVTSM